MSEGESAKTLSTLLTALESNLYDLSLHSQHIKLTSEPGKEDEARSARQLMIEFWPAGDEVWFPLIDSRAQEGIDSIEDAMDVHAMFVKAENDYLSIPLLQKHLQFLIDRHAHFQSQHLKPAEYFTVDWTRKSMADIVAKCAGHLTQGHLLWDARCDWELEQIDQVEGKERIELIVNIEQMYLERLQQPHSTNEETFQAYSTFTTTYKPANLYEKILLNASKARTQAVKAYDRRDRWELQLSASGFSPEAYDYYINYERRARKVDITVLAALYERAIADCAKRRFEGSEIAEYAMRAFWFGYSDSLRTHSDDSEKELSVLKRAVRSTPGCGALWARYIRALERMDEHDQIDEIYINAFKSGLLEKSVEDVVTVVRARAGQLKRSIMASVNAGSDVETLLKVLKDGIAMVRQASPEGDPQFRLEKLLSKIYIYIYLEDSPDLATEVWETTAKHYKTNFTAWLLYADSLVEQGKFDEARAVYKTVVARRNSWPEPIFDAWEAFEHLHGSLESLEDCLSKIERAQQQLYTRRAKEAEEAQIIAEPQSTSAPTNNAALAIQDISAADNVQAMDLDDSNADNTKKRKHAENFESNSKKQKPDVPVPLKRDRENCTVFVADLPPDVTEEDLAVLFKDCGSLRETKVTDLKGTRVAAVEFSERDSVLGALTKDKKRVRGHDVAVHLAWQSTLYVTNFPESTDDAFIRNLFGQYGIIFDVRWPSKKFRSTRRFCYVQFTSPKAAESSLSLHGQELEGGLRLNVYISNPERKKERTDAGANDREVYIAGLSKFVTNADLEKLFKTYGDVKDVRMATDDKGHSKGFAFVEFEDEAAARKALQANNYDLKNRRIAVTISDSRVRARRPPGTSAQIERAETKSRSIRVRNLPEDTQEGLLQQALEKILPIKRVEVFQDIREAVVEYESVSDAGRMLLLPDPVIFNDKQLVFSEEDDVGAKRSQPSTSTSSTGMFIPRSAASRPRAGLGMKNPKTSSRGLGGSQASAANDKGAINTSSSGKGQDDFRKMLG